MGRLDQVDLEARLRGREYEQRLEGAPRRLIQLRLHLGGQLGNGDLGPGLLIVLEGPDALTPNRVVATTGQVLEGLAAVDGVVLKRFRESEGVVPAGERLVEIGDPSHVEIVADLPPSDAAKVEPGMRVDVEHWGGDTPLAGWVERVESTGFTKMSPQGVEEPRVSVIIDFEDDRAAWRARGDGFRVEVRIAIWEAEDVLRVPTGALFRAGDQWAVYVVRNGRARRVLVELGERTELQVEVRKDLSAGQQVVLNPPDTLTENARVAVRE